MMDKVVAATQYRDFILIFTERGKVYKLVWKDFPGDGFYLHKMMEEIDLR